MTRSCKWQLMVLLVLGLFVSGAVSAYSAEGAKRPKAAAGTKFVGGKVSTVDLEGKVLTLKGKDGKETTVTWTDGTKLAWRAGKGKPVAANSSDLKVGQRVTAQVVPGADGTLVAQNIWIRKAMPARAAQHPKTPPAK
jgi:hypothetical protein